jgi:hypothetical protein
LSPRDLRGIGYKFRDFIQAIHRIHRYLQPHDVTIDIVFATSQRPIVERARREVARHDTMMRAHVRDHPQYGLNSVARRPAQRSIGVERAEERGEAWTAVNNDCVERRWRWSRDSST